MKKFQILRYLKKYQFLIAVISLVAGIIVIWLANRYQTYTAATIIQYTNQNAAEGLAPDGSNIDVSEISSSNLMRIVMDNLEIDYSEYNLDNLRSRVSVQEVVTDEEEVIEAALNEDGESYDVFPATYLVTFTSSSSEGGEFARKILSELMDVYTTEYGRNHVNSSAEINRTSEIFESGYDYIEMMEVIRDSINETMGRLSEKDSLNTSFRSNATGYSFWDLYEEFEYLRDKKVSDVFATILNNQVTKDKDVLIDKYEKRLADLELSNTSDTAEIDDILAIVDSYVDMMRESGNTNITYEYILNDIYDNYYTDEQGNWHGQDQTVEYDQLLSQYVSNRESYENAIIQAVYYQYIIDMFSEPSDASIIPADIVSEVSEVAMETPVSSADIEADVDNQIRTIVARLDELYEVAAITNDEFNEYSGAANVAVLSSIGVTEQINIWLFAILAIVIFGVVGCFGAIFLGRMGDIVEYYMYTDHGNGLPNRAKCDLYIREHSTSMLPPHFSCIMFNLLHIREYNETFGRGAGNEAINSYSQVLQQVFGGVENSFLAYNGIGQYIIFVSGLKREQVKNYLDRLETAVLDYNRDHEHPLHYRCGIAETETEKVYDIRTLITRAAQNMNEIIWGAQQKTEDDKKYSHVVDDVYEVEPEETKERSAFKTEENPGTSLNEKEIKDRMREYYEKYLNASQQANRQENTTRK